MKTNENVLRSRAPRGVRSDKPVAIRLLPAEIAELEALALEQNRSMSSMARIIYLNGITLFRQLITKSISVQEVKSGKEIGRNEMSIL